MGDIGYPPGPIGLPLLGVLPQFRRNPARYLLQLSQKFGDICYFRVGASKLYLLNRPDLIEEVLVSSQGNFTKSRLLQRGKRLLGEGLLTSEGALHLRQRRFVQTAFHRDRLAAYAERMVSEAERVEHRWRGGSTVDLSSEMMRLTLAIVASCMFSCDIEEDAQAIGRAVSRVVGSFDAMLLPFQSVLEALPFGPFARLRAAHKVLDDKIYAIVGERRTDRRDRGDLLSMLLSAEETDGQMTDKQVRDECMTLMLAGHETTANALTWTWFLLSQHPEIEQQLRREWAEVLAGRQPQFSDLPQLCYTERVLLEALRLYPPAWAISRMARNQFRLFNYVIPEGAVCVMSPYAMHRNPRFWPAPDKFDPDRFTPEARAQRPKFAYFPFGGGPRVCIGERFATMEGVLLLASIGQKWRLRLAPGQNVDIRPQMTLRPRFGMNMITERVVG